MVGQILGVGGERQCLESKRPFLHIKVVLEFGIKRHPLFLNAAGLCI